jgi:hypothetical protein
MVGKTWKVSALAVLVGLIVCVGTQAQEKKPGKVYKAEDFTSKDYKVKEKGKATLVVAFPAGKSFHLSVRCKEKSDVNLFILDADKKEVKKDDSPGPDCDIDFKPEKAGNYTIEIRNLGPGNNVCTLKIEPGK